MYSEHFHPNTDRALSELTAGLANFPVKTVLSLMKCSISHDPIMVIADTTRATKPSQGMAYDFLDLNSWTGSARSGMNGWRRFLVFKSSVLGEVSSVVEVVNWLATPILINRSGGQKTSCY